MPRWVRRFQASTPCSVSGAPTAPNQPGGRDRGVAVVVPTGFPCRRSPLWEAGVPNPPPHQPLRQHRPQRYLPPS
jgi:hypothetical protein